ncbi:pseudouridine synthase [Exophiala viscosa]|uniref:Pseudouridine synthase n=1 Tax=Exophiala viscosa TaxID=2486360 RepID=A0AAN6E2Q3_9EURO|nr:pseudouridine synthase [Exophiala viscosa]
MSNDGQHLNEDYSKYSTTDLINRISGLEEKLREHNAQLAALTSKSKSTHTPSPAPSRPRTPSPKRQARPFDPSLYSSRHIALRFAYLGGRYNGFEHANGNVTPMPTIEEVLWKALRKSRLISPEIPDGVDGSMEVLWPAGARMQRYTKDDAPGKVRLDLNWEGCQYSKCGRTDRGVSAFGQVVGVRVRSNRPLPKQETETQQNGHVLADTANVDENMDADDDMPGIEVDDLDEDTYAKPWDSVKDELSYVSILNAILPPDIRVLAWCPDPPPTFDARFSCRERRYKYFFTNPAFCPVPGPPGMKFAAGKSRQMREGWLDIDKMREAAKKLEGLHDFRHLCKIDASKQMPSCERRITFADVVEFGDVGTAFSEQEGLSQFAGKSLTQSLFGQTGLSSTAGPKVYTLCVHGNAFLWHQVRCMVAVLFLVGQGLEEPSIVDEMLDINTTPRRPTYEMADDAPLVLWDCIFPADDGDIVDSLNWLYAGDEANVRSGLTTKGDGKFGPGGVVEELWSIWHEAQMQEILAGSLLDLAIHQGDGNALRKGVQINTPRGPSHSQKVFQGGNEAKSHGRYVPIMQRPRMDSLEAVNAKWAKSRKARLDVEGYENTD